MPDSKKLLLRLDMSATPDDLEGMIENNSGSPRYFRVDTSDAGRPLADMMKLALDDGDVKRLLVALTNRGYVLYYNIENESRFIRADRIRHHWEAVKSGKYEYSDSGVVHSLEMPSSGRAERLIVVMSPLSSSPCFSRYFRPSFGTLMKYIAPNTAILRLADLGGVKGAFYMNTIALPQNSMNVHGLIRRHAEQLGVKDKSIILYGASKGGTVALFHGLSGGWKFVAVDPIVSDHWYEVHKRDYHFTAGGVFPSSKQAVFSELMSEVSESGGLNQDAVVITS